MGELLESIKKENDIKRISPDNYRELACQIREFIIKNVIQTGGHLASNLGVVELTMALHLCCNFPEDKIVFDVGHQCYTHKILTGRMNQFTTLRKLDGLSGFPKISESQCDAFDTGHSSTSISLAIGMAKARDLLKENNKVFAVIGDGALSGGMAYEALNNAARLKSNLIIVINDNQMSISKNVGGMSNYLGKIRTNKKYTGLKENVESALNKVPGGVGDRFANKIRGAKDVVKRVLIPGMLFEDMGLTYIGPIDGHDVKQMVDAFKSALKMKEAVIVHVCTKKGKGYRPAEKDPSRYHGIAALDVKSVKERKPRIKPSTYTDVFGKKIVEMARTDERIVAVSAAMPLGTGLTSMSETFPERFFDVGIAEEHAVTFAAGMASQGIRPVVAIYSTFFQRAYDQIISDVCLLKLPVILAIDRAGLVGSDGETHQGIFDISYLIGMPGITVMSPKNAWELEEMMDFAIDVNGPVAIRYPRGIAKPVLQDYTQKIELGKSEIIKNGKDIALIAIGNMVNTACEVAGILDENNMDVTVINARFIKPLDEKLLDEISSTHKWIFTIEDGVKNGGFGQSIAAYCAEKAKVKVHSFGYPDKFIEHGTCEQLRERYGLTAEMIAQRIQNTI